VKKAAPTKTARPVTKQAPTKKAAAVKKAPLAATKKSGAKRR
jgi:hypothetical protein